MKASTLIGKMESGEIPKEILILGYPHHWSHDFDRSGSQILPGLGAFLLSEQPAQEQSGPPQEPAGKPRTTPEDPPLYHGPAILL
jgi:hypothetical protein